MTSTATSQAMLNHHQQLEDHNQDEDHMCFFSFPPNNNLTLPPLIASSSSPSSSSHQSLKTFTILPCSSNLHETLLLSSSSPTTTSPQQQQQLLSLQRPSANLWSWEGVSENNMKRSGDENVNNLRVSATKMKKIIGRRKVRDPRFSFKTMTDVDVLDDGYKWRKYGQKVVKNTHHPRSYYRCTQDNCRVKKRVERLAEDPRMVITTYEGRHAHSPSHDLEGSQSPSHLTNFFC